MIRNVRLLLVALLLALGPPGTAFAQTKEPDLAHASIEDLLNVEITSVSRKEQRLNDTAAALIPQSASISLAWRP